MGKPKVRAEDIGGGRLPKFQIRDYVEVYCGSREGHHFWIKDVRWTDKYPDYRGGTFEYLYDAPLMGGWLPEQFLVLIKAAATAPAKISQPNEITIPAGWKFAMDQRVKKRGIKGQWHGRVCGPYSTQATPRGYAVVSLLEENSVQVWPEEALEEWND